MASDLMAIAWITPESAPGWAQAVLIVLTIAFTYWLARRQDRRADRQDESERRHRAQALATALFPSLLQLKKLIQQKRSRIEDRTSLNVDDRLSLGDTVIQRSRPLQITIPSMLQDSWQTHYQLGGAGASLLQMLAMIHQYNDLIEEAERRLISERDEGSYQGALNSLYGYLPNIEKNRAEAEALIGAIQDGRFRAGWY